MLRSSTATLVSFICNAYRTSSHNQSCALIIFPNPKKPQQSIIQKHMRCTSNKLHARIAAEKNDRLPRAAQTAYKARTHFSVRPRAKSLIPYSSSVYTSTHTPAKRSSYHCRHVIPDTLSLARPRDTLVVVTRMRRGCARSCSPRDVFHAW